MSLKASPRRKSNLLSASIAGSRVSAQMKELKWVDDAGEDALKRAFGAIFRVGLEKKGTEACDL